MWGFPARKMGNPQLAGWFLLGKIPSRKMDDDWGYPHDYGKPHMFQNHLENSEVFINIPAVSQAFNSRQSSQLD